MFEDVEHAEYLRAESEEKFSPTHWYCLYCIDVSWPQPSGWYSEGGVAGHCRDKHGMDKDLCKVGVDYVLGDDLVVILREWRIVNEGMADQFERKLCSILSVDDFLFETDRR